MTNSFFKNNYMAVLRSESRPGLDLGSRCNTGPGPGPEFAGPGPEVWVQGLQKSGRTGPGLDCGQSKWWQLLVRYSRLPFSLFQPS